MEIGDFSFDELLEELKRRHTEAERERERVAAENDSLRKAVDEGPADTISDLRHEVDTLKRERKELADLNKRLRAPQ